MVTRKRACVRMISAARGLVSISLYEVFRRCLELFYQIRVTIARRIPDAIRRWILRPAGSYVVDRSEPLGRFVAEM